MGHRIVVTAWAERDLLAIHEYISQDDPLAARGLILRLKNELKLTLDFSQAGKVVPEVRRTEVRELIRNPDRIIYRIRAEEKVIEVLRFWHSARGKPKI